MAHWQCKYCDRPAGYMGIPIEVGDELICACGAEWADARIYVEDDEIEECYFEEFDEEDDWEVEDDEEEDNCFDELDAMDEKSN